MLDGIAAAFITAAAAIAAVVYQGRRTRKVGSWEHNEARKMIADVRDGVAAVDHKIDDLRADLEAHLDTHQENPE
jgi:hypothetical protein